MSLLAAGGFAFERGLQDLGNGAWAWLQPDGGWGWSNAGLIASGEDALLVDTLFDVPKTSDMLAAMRRSVPAAADIKTLVNTHSNGDHTHGNELVAGEGVEIISSRAAAGEMKLATPERLAALMKTARAGDDQLARYLVEAFGAFDFEGIQHTLPNRTFEESLELTVGEKRVVLLEVGPAHTEGDIMVWVPDDKTVFTGDILFIDGTPLIWAGPVSNWIAACDKLLAMDLETIVPGHGPITDHRGPQAVREYLLFIEQQARERYAAGLDALAAAQDIALGDFDAWGDAERIAVNVETLYREFDRQQGIERPPVDIMELFRRMAIVAGGRRS